jgi:glycosyltransferase involved in cell wall biosynthesis
MPGDDAAAAAIGEAGVAPAEAIAAFNRPAAGALDVLIVSLGSTGGLRRADDELAGSLRRVGASAAVVAAAPPRQMRTFALTDLGWALAARRAARAELARRTPRAVIYSSTTAALLWPRPGAIRFDAPSAGNRPGRHGLWQRPLERRRLRQASLLLPWSDGGLREAPAAARGAGRVLVLPVAVEPSVAEDRGREKGAVSGPGAGIRDIAAVTYAANPTKKGLDRVLAAWRAVRRPGEELLVMGADAKELQLATTGVRVVGMLPYHEYRGLLRRARVFVCAPRREDYGIAQLEALADGCVLVTTPAPGPYAALPIARELDQRLVGEDLPRALRTALDDPAPDYAARAIEALAPFSREALDRLVAERLLPRLLA